MACDDGDACTEDSCDTETGCTTAPTTCDDQDACTVDGCDPALARLSALQIDSTLRKGRRPSAPTKSTKEERRRIAQLQELENSIAELEAKLANLGLQLESPLVKPHEVAKLGTEYERVQKEMDAKLNEWERIQVQ
jgi:hypothetical protein